MKYRAFWKDTWYVCEDYGALCRCLAWVGAESFIRDDYDVSSSFRNFLLSTRSVIVSKVKDEI